MTEPHDAPALPVLDCKTPACPEARPVILGGPTATEWQGAPATAVCWWCARCGSLWRSVARQTVWAAD